MLKPCLRPSHILSKLLVSRPTSGRSFTANPLRFAHSEEPLSKEPAQEQQKPQWTTLAGTGVLAAAIIGSATWLAFAEESQTLQHDGFQDYELLKNKRISLSSNLLTIQPSTFGPRAYRSSLDNQKVAEFSRKGIWSVQIKHPLLTIARLYTPLPPFLSDPIEPTPHEKFGFISANPEENQLRFLIRNNPEGELSRYLSRMQAGGRLELRGPYQEFEVPDDVSNIIFLAGGTGISPAIQMAHSMLDSPSESPKPSINILWANRRGEESSGALIEPLPRPENLFLRVWSMLSSSETPQTKISATSNQPESPIITELSTLKTRYTGTLNVSYFADDQQRFITQQDIQGRLRKLVHRGTARAPTEVASKNLIIISGPDGFVEHFAGPKVWKEGKELQGTLEGLLSKMDLHGWTVWKL
ncbi:MAG: hypothetical protein Q9170_008005 [Blastenia crenularia]